MSYELRVRLFALIALMVSALCSCATDDDGGTVIDNQNRIEISGQAYELRSARYFDGFYEFVGEDCICLHLQFLLNGANTGAGMTVELSKALVGERVAIAPSDVFWFFHIGTGSASVSLENTYAPEKFENRIGWFCIDYGAGENEIILEWELTDDSGDRTVSKGYIASVFEEISV